ncbi:MAG TPA: phosphate ABC transporter substrate-binding protein PstS [Vicinamibacterales bacterium]|nr:phosphate ABC transporter substrate-binding protein PstS [Vicinamibacterales bacterium]
MAGLFVVPACGGGAADTTNGVKLQGAGASFPAPLYTKWFKAYSSSHQNVLVDYQSVGSGSGVKSVIDHTVDFGASDAAMKPEDMAKVPEGVQLFPMTAGSIVLAYNLQGVPNLQLSRKAYTGIFLGKITRWNDPAIVEANPGVKLPDLPVNVVVRADSSGTSFVFSQHLSAVSDDFGKSVGANTMPNWPTGTKSKGNEGITAAILSTPGSIGYIEYGYAKSQMMAMATLENKSGKFVAASTASGQAALASAALPDDMIAWAKDPDVPEAYPIVTYTWLICYKKYPSKDKMQAVQELVKYGLTEGQKDAETLGYIPLPDTVVAKATSAIQNLSTQ